jgi:hypothetical protein
MTAKTTAIVPFNPGIAWLNGDRKIDLCFVNQFFGKSCRECFLKKYKPEACCDGPCEVCGHADCPHHGGKVSLYA